MEVRRRFSKRASEREREILLGLVGSRGGEEDGLATAEAVVPDDYVAPRHHERAGRVAKSPNLFPFPLSPTTTAATVHFSRASNSHFPSLSRSADDCSRVRDAETAPHSVVLRIRAAHEEC